MEPTQIYWPGTEILRTDDLPAGTTVDLVNVNAGRYNPELAFAWLTLGRELYDRYNQYGLDVPEPQVTGGDLSYVTITDLMNALGPALDPIKALRNAMFYMGLDDTNWEQYYTTETAQGGRYLPLQATLSGGASGSMFYLWNPNTDFPQLFNMGNLFTTELLTWWNNNIGYGYYPVDLASIYAAQLMQALMEYNVVWVADDTRWVSLSPITNREKILAMGGENTVAKYYAFFGVDYWSTKQARADAWMADPYIDLYNITIQYDLVINLPKILPGQDDDDGQLGSGGSGSGGSGSSGSGSGGSGSGGGTGDGQDEESTMWPVALLLAVLFLGGKKSYRA